MGVKTKATGEVDINETMLNLFLFSNGKLQRLHLETVCERT